MGVSGGFGRWAGVRPPRGSPGSPVEEFCASGQSRGGVLRLGAGPWGKSGLGAGPWSKSGLGAVPWRSSGVSAPGQSRGGVLRLGAVPWRSSPPRGAPDLPPPPGVDSVKRRSNTERKTFDSVKCLKRHWTPIRSHFRVPLTIALRLGFENVPL